MTARDARTSDGRRLHVLAIDDAPEVLDLCVELLESEAYRVTASPTLLSVDEIGALAPDAIVHDRNVVARLERFAVPVILKPFSREGMLNVIAQVLERPEPGAKTLIDSSCPHPSEGVRPVVDWCAP